MPTFDYEFSVDAPLEAVREFHRDTSVLKKLTPPPTIVQLHDIEPLAEGSVSQFTLWVGPLPIKWKAVHRDVSAHGFTDVQEAGPVCKWEHTHTFTSQTPGTTKVTEHIEFEHKRGVWGAVTRLLFAGAAISDTGFRGGRAGLGNEHADAHGFRFLLGQEVAQVFLCGLGYLDHGGHKPD